MAVDSGRLRRIVLVTVVLAVVGALIGGAIGALLVGAMVATLGRGAPDALFLSVGARFGAGFGFVLAPIAAWTLMRRVPLWRAIVDTAIGTTIGAGLGLVLQSRIHSAVVSPVILGVVGFALAAIRLRLSYRAQRKDAARDVHIG